MISRVPPRIQPDIPAQTAPAIPAPAPAPVPVPAQMTPSPRPAPAAMAETGILPEAGLLAAAYVPFQRKDSPRYGVDEALKNGTLFPGLNLPYGKYLPSKNAAETPEGQLMALSFVLNELGLYLDTHPDDAEALRLRNGFVGMYNEAAAAHAEMRGPITQNVVMDGKYTWIDNPWPWERR